MKIISLQAENVKRLTAVEIKPDGALVQITGRNGAGKTSVLDAIWWALSNARHIQAAPIRRGASKARIRLDLGDLIVTRRFTRQEDETFTTSITVENAEGARFPSPQKVLDELDGALSFDPLQFVRMDAKEQVQTLKTLVPAVDFAAFESANKADYERRTELNRDYSQLRARAAAIHVEDGLPAEPLDEAGLIERLSSAAEHNAGIELERMRQKAERDSIEVLAKDVAGKVVEIDNLKVRIAALQQDIEQSRRRIAEKKAALEALPSVPEPARTEDLRQQIADAKRINEKIAHRASKANLARLALEAEVAAGKLTKAIADRGAAMAAAIEQADLPVPGLSLGDGQVMFNGLPFSQASDAEQLRASMAIAMAMSPKLQVIRVRDGSLLDADGLRIVSEMAEQRGFQVWIERVDTSGAVGFVIEDGALKAQPILVAAE